MEYTINKSVPKAKIRKESQSDSLLVVCDSIFGKEKKGKGKIGIPKYCFKVVQPLSSKKILHCLFFTNTDEAVYDNRTLKALEKSIGYKLQVKK